MTELLYVAAFHPDDDEGGYTVTFPDAPGAVTEGDTFEKAVANAHEALALHLEDGEPPAPTPLKALYAALIEDGAIPVPIALARSQTPAPILTKLPRDWTRFVAPLPHPGEILAQNFMEPLGLSAGQLSKLMGLGNRQRIERISRGQQGVSADTALRLGRVLGTSAEFWTGLQDGHELSAAAIAARADLARLKKYEPPSR